MICISAKLFYIFYLMVRKKLILKILLLVFVVSSSMAEDISAYEKNSIFVIKELSHKLKTTVKSVMQKSGAIEAIEYCNIAALDLTEEVAIDSALVLKRTSLKYRNNHNAPDNWELSVLKRFEKRKSDGEDINLITESAIIDSPEKIFRYMKAIPTGKPCLTCHGAEIKSNIVAKINELYPYDKAKNFKVGDIRGAFSVIIPIEN